MAANTKPTVILSADVVAIARKVGTQIKGANKVAVELGKLALQAGKLVSAEALDAFINECKKACGDAPEATVKVYMSNVRGVIRAIHEGYEPEAGTSIKAMYAAAPKGTGRQSTPGARTIKGKDQSGTKEPASVDVTSAVAKLPARDKLRLVCNMVFGHADDELMSAVEWASMNESAFIRMVTESVGKADTAKDETPARKMRKAA